MIFFNLTEINGDEDAEQDGQDNAKGSEKDEKVAVRGYAGVIGKDKYVADFHPGGIVKRYHATLVNFATMVDIEWGPVMVFAVRRKDPVKSARCFKKSRRGDHVVGVLIPEARFVKHSQTFFPHFTVKVALIGLSSLAFGLGVTA